MRSCRGGAVLTPRREPIKHPIFYCAEVINTQEIEVSSNSIFVGVVII